MRGGHVNEIIKNKKYEIVLENPKSGRHRVYRIFYGTSREADAFAIQLKAEIIKGSYVDPSRLLGQHYALCFVAVWTGLRRGELLGIRWQDISFETEQLSVRQAVAYTPELGIFIKKKLKNKNSRRTIDISPEVIDVLTVLRQKQDELKSMYGKKYEDNDLIFCQPDGKAMHPDTPSSWFPEFLEKIIVHYECV